MSTGACAGRADSTLGPGAGRTPVVVFGDREGFGDEVGVLLEPFLNLKKLHGTPSLFESLHYIGRGQILTVSSD